jgi:hypothetical protein
MDNTILLTEILLHKIMNLNVLLFIGVCYHIGSQVVLIITQSSYTNKYYIDMIIIFGIFSFFFFITWVYLMENYPHITNKCKALIAGFMVIFIGYNGFMISILIQIFNEVSAIKITSKYIVSYVIFNFIFNGLIITYEIISLILLQNSQLNSLLIDD